MPTLVRKRSIDDALEWLRSTPLASGNSFTLGSRDRSVVVEASAKGVTVAADGERALHTNHALAEKPVWAYQRFGNSQDRLTQLQQQVVPTATVEHVVTMYASGAVCRSRESESDVMSIGTMIFELGDTQVCHYAPGPLDTEQLTTYQMG